MVSDSSSTALFTGSNFGFAFNDSNFSDRILTIEIIPDFLECKSDGEISPVIEDSSDAPLGDEAVEDNDPQVLRVKTIHISSPILAANSPFFYKMFSNGMRESEQRHVNLRIHDSEEAPFMELLNHIYSGSVSATTPRALLDVLMVADKFEVESCVRYCSKLLWSLPMTCEYALLYLNLPSSVSSSEAVQPLTETAKQYLAAHYRNVTKFTKEVLNLPLAGIEAVFSSGNLRVSSEDVVCGFLLEWARLHYPKLEERRKVLGSHLGHLIRFQYMTCWHLKKLFTCDDFEPEYASHAVVNALFFKADSPYSRTCHGTCMERDYKYLPAKVVHFESPSQQQCVVYLELKREECLRLFPGGRVSSELFHLGGHGFFLCAHCSMHQKSSLHRFGVFLKMKDKESAHVPLDYEICARANPTKMYKGNYTITGAKSRNLFSTPWTEFIGEDSFYFINDILHLRAELTIRQ